MPFPGFNPARKEVGRPASYGPGITKTTWRYVMKSFKRKVVVLALAGGSGLIGLASPAAAAGPNDGGTNCHGVVLSYFATSDMSPGQLHKNFGVSAKDVQATAEILCGP